MSDAVETLETANQATHDQTFKNKHQHKDNLIENGNVEKGNVHTGLPSYWINEQLEPGSIFEWDTTHAYQGHKSIKITSPALNDAWWIGTPLIPMQLDKLYSLSGWIKTDNVPKSPGPGANLSVFSSWMHSPGLTGTRDWTYESFLFRSNVTQTMIAARMGHWGNYTSGTAWFDDMRLAPLHPMRPHPQWKILVLIYDKTDFTYIDAAGIQHHVVGAMSESEKANAAEQATLFVNQDIPALSSNNMVPRLTIRYPQHPLTTLTPAYDGWSPAPDEVPSVFRLPAGVFYAAIFS